MGVQTHVLVVGATRPAMIMGITYEAIVFIAMAVGVSYVFSENPLLLLTYLPLHGIAYLICLKDPRAFRLITAWLATKGRCFNRLHWQSASYSPAHFRKR